MFEEYKHINASGVSVNFLASVCVFFMAPAPRRPDNPVPRRGVLVA